MGAHALTNSDAPRDFGRLPLRERLSSMDCRRRVALQAIDPVPMILTLQAVTLNDQPLTRPITARFDVGGGSIGRADHSTMALPDPERFISRRQAEIVFVNGGFMVRNVGAANPIIVGGRTLAGGETLMLSDGDEVRIGGYQLRARIEAAAEITPPPRVLTTVSLAPAAPARPATDDLAAARRAPSAAAPPPSRSQASAAVAPETGANPFADLLGPTPMIGAAPARVDDPFADLLGPPPTPPVSAATSAPAAANPFDGLLPPPAGVDPRSAAVAAPPAPAPRLPDDFDPFRVPAAPPPPVPSAAGADPFADLVPVAGGPSVDANFGLQAPAGDDDALARFLSDGSSPASSGAAGASIAVDPLQLFGPDVTEPSAAPAAAALSNEARATGQSEAPMPQPDHLSALNAAYAPPLRAAPPTPPAAARQAAPATPAALDEGSDGSAAALWAAFCAGAQVQLPLPAGSGTERMQMIGRILRSAVEGTLQLMAVRASTKHEMRAAVTQIQARSNNPLKFSPDGASGIEQLVQPPARGFLDGPAAMDDAMRDLVAHSIGTVAGMRAAIEGMLDRFDPAELEGKLGAGSMLDSLLPMNRKARLWELYLQHYRTIREEAQEDFHNLFGKAFVAAYEQQVERLKQRPRS